MSETMKKFILGSCAACMIASCVNPEYDLENIKIDQIHGLDNISVPVGDSRKIVLSELLENEEFVEYLKTYDNGDYYFNLLSGKKDQSVDVPDFYFAGYDEENPNETTIDTPIAVNELVSGLKLGPVPFSEITYDIEIDHVSVDYSLTCDAFGKDFQIAINEDFTGLGLEIHDVDLAQAQVKFTLTSALPFDFNFSAQALDAAGNVLETISVEADGGINGGTVESPAVNHLTVNLINEGDLVLDGVRLSMSAKVSGERAVLNKDQYIQITDISVCLPKGITYCINETI